MPLFNKQELIQRVNLIEGQVIYKSADQILEKNFSEFSSTRTYDTFLSHSYRDATVILGLKQFLENLGHSVYVDWVEDKQLDRSKVTKSTADLLRVRMRNCKSLLFTVSDNSPKSIWMPWELGYFDGIKGKVAILPITEVASPSENYSGQEYLGLYPYITKQKNSDGKMTLWINDDPNTYVAFSGWIAGAAPSLRR